MFIKKKVILDTNFLLIPGTFGVDVFSELNELLDFSFQVCVLSRSLEELERVIDRGGKAALDAKLGFILAKQKKLRVLKSKGYVDDTLVKLASKGVIICTQDKELKRRIKAAKGRVVTLRSKKKLVLAS